MWRLLLLMLLLLAPPAEPGAPEWCSAPLGMESGRIPDEALSASSSFDDGNVGPQNARLRTERAGGAWCPRVAVGSAAKEWLEVRLNGPHVLTALATQGRFGNAQGREYAEHYLLEYWRPTTSWRRLPRRLPGNTNTYLERRFTLPAPLVVERVRFLPVSDRPRTVCIRVELYGCPYRADIISYSAPPGDTRPDMDTMDSEYDGLGRLTDGRRGSGRTGFVGWEPARSPVEVQLTFDVVREFRDITLHVRPDNGEIFSEVRVWFSVGGRQYQEEPVVARPRIDRTSKSDRNVTVPLQRRIGRYLKLQIVYEDYWLLISEITVDSVEAIGNYSFERGGPNPDRRPAHQLPAALLAGAGAALVLLLLAGAALLLRRRRTKCADLPQPPPAPPDDYQEPYTPLKWRDDVLIEMGRMGQADNSNYEYAVPELSSAPLLRRSPARPAPPTAPPAAPLAAPPAPSEPRSYCSNDTRLCSDGSPCGWDEPGAALLAEYAECGRISPGDRMSSPGMISPSGRTSPNGSSDSELDLRERTEPLPEIPSHRLRMLSKLAEGAFGTVYIAEAEGVPPYPDGRVVRDGAHTRTLVAVKFLQPNHTPQERSHFIREVDILAHLSSPRLARPLGMCGPGVVLEYPARGPLSEQLCEGRVPPARRRRIAADVARALRYLARRTLVHRDVAARNVLLSHDYAVKLSDLGADVEAHAHEYVSLGGATIPLRWTAPEAALHGQFSPRSDCWSFGVLLWEVYSSGARPYGSATDAEVVRLLRRARADRRLPRPASAPAPVHALMVACWQPDPMNRPSAAALVRVLTRPH